MTVDMISCCRSFASGICGKLSEMLDRTSVPLDIKMKLLSIFEHMRFDPDNYEKVCFYTCVCSFAFAGTLLIYIAACCWSTVLMLCWNVQVRMMCTQMLVGYPSCKFVVAVLRTLTHLSACSLIDIPAQVTWMSISRFCVFCYLQGFRCRDADFWFFCGTLPGTLTLFPVFKK